MEWNNLSIPKLQRCNRWSLGMHKWFPPTLYWVCDYLSMMGLKLIHVSKRGPRSQKWVCRAWISNCMLQYSMQYHHMHYGSSNNNIRFLKISTCTVATTNQIVRTRLIISRFSPTNYQVLPPLHWTPTNTCTERFRQSKPIAYII